MTPLAIRIVMLAAVATHALACSCAFQPLKETYCKSETAAVGTVVARFDNCPGKQCDPVEDQVLGETFYIVRVASQFRGDPIEDGVMRLRTAVNSGLCGIQLDVNRRYLFALGKGRKSGVQCGVESFSVGLCDGIVLWSMVPRRDKWAIWLDAYKGVGCT